MYNLIGIYNDGSERILAKGFVSWGAAWGVAEACERIKPDDTTAPIGYRVERAS